MTHNQGADTPMTGDSDFPKCAIKIRTARSIALEPKCQHCRTGPCQWFQKHYPKPEYPPDTIASLQAALSAERSKNAAIRKQALEEAAKKVQEEICGCCWSEDAQEFAEHAAAAIRSLVKG